LSGAGNAIPESTPESPNASLPPFRIEDLPVLSPLKVPRPSGRQVTFAGTSSSSRKALANLGEKLLEPVSEAELARMVKIKEEAFDEGGHFNPGWKEQFVPVAAPEPGIRPIDQYVF